MFGEYAQIASYISAHDGNNQDQGAKQRSLPAYLRPSYHMPNPWGLGLEKSRSIEDFIMVAEFSELEGPTPVMTIPKDGGHNFDQNAFSVRILAVDHQSSSEGFTITEDAQVVLTDVETGAFAFVHHIVLFDNTARGFVRPFCIAYITNEQRKLLHFYEELSSQFKKVAKLLKYGNRLLFVRDLERHLNDLEHTKGYLLNQVSKMRLRDSENSPTLQEFRKNTDNELYRGLQTIRQSSSEIADILSILRPLLSDKRMESRFRVLEDRAFQDLTAAGHDKLSLQENWFNDQSSLDGLDVRYGSLNEPRRSPLSLFKEKDYKPVLVETKKARRFNAPLRGLHELCSWGAKEGLKKLRHIHEYFRRDYSVLELQKNESTLFRPHYSSVFHGNCVTGNFLTGLHMKQSSNIQEGTEGYSMFYSHSSFHARSLDSLDSFKSFNSDGSGLNLDASTSSLQTYDSQSVNVFESAPSSPGRFEISLATENEYYFDEEDKPKEEGITEEELQFSNSPSNSRTVKCQSYNLLYNSSPRSNGQNHQDMSANVHCINDRMEKVVKDVCSSSVPVSAQGDFGYTGVDVKGSINHSISMPEDVGFGASVQHTVSDTNSEQYEAENKTQELCRESLTLLSTLNGGERMESSHPEASLPSLSETITDDVSHRSNTVSLSSDCDKVDSDAQFIQHSELPLAAHEIKKDSRLSALIAKEDCLLNQRGKGPAIDLSRTMWCKVLSKQTSEDLSPSSTASGLDRQTIPALSSISSSDQSITRHSCLSEDDCFWKLRSGSDVSSAFTELSVRELFPHLMNTGTDCLSSMGSSFVGCSSGNYEPLDCNEECADGPSSSSMGLWKPRCGLYTIGDWLNIFGSGRPEWSLCELLSTYNHLQHVIFSLLIGRPVLVAGPANLQAEVVKVVNTLSVFVASCKRKQHGLLGWTSKPLKITDLTKLRLVGICRPEKKTLNSYIPSSIKKACTVFDVERKMIYAPFYQGQLITSLMSKRKTLKTDIQLLSYIQWWLMEIVGKSFIFFHSFCLSSDGSIFHLGNRNSYTRAMTDKMAMIGIKDLDCQIVEYLTEMVKKSYLEGHICHGADSGNMVPPLHLQHKVCQTFRC